MTRLVAKCSHFVTSDIAMPDMRWLPNWTGQFGLRMSSMSKKDVKRVKKRGKKRVKKFQQMGKQICVSRDIAGGARYEIAPKLDRSVWLDWRLKNVTKGSVKEGNRVASKD